MNTKFLQRWPSGKGEGWVAEQIAPNWDWNVVKVTTHNTSGLENGGCECWPQWGGKLGRRFWNVDQIFHTEAGAVDFVNSNIKQGMDNITESIKKLNIKYNALQSKLII